MSRKKTKEPELHPIPAPTPFAPEENTELIKKNGFPISTELRGLMVSSAKLVLERALEIGDALGIMKALRVLIEMNAQNAAFVRIGKDSENAKLLAESQRRDSHIVLLLAKLIPDPVIRISIIQGLENGELTEQEIIGAFAQGRNGLVLQDLSQASVEYHQPGNPSGLGEAS